MSNNNDGEKPKSDVSSDNRPVQRNKGPVTHDLRSKALREGRIQPFRGNNRKLIAIKKWQAQLISDLGGVESVTAAQLQLIDSITRLRGRIDYADLWLSKQPTLIDETTNSMYPAVMQWRSLIESMSKLLNQLFPEGVGKRVQRELNLIEQLEAESAEARKAREPEAEIIPDKREPEQAIVSGRQESAGSTPGSDEGEDQ